MVEFFAVLKVESQQVGDVFVDALEARLRGSALRLLVELAVKLYVVHGLRLLRCFLYYEIRGAVSSGTMLLKTALRLLARRVQAEPSPRNAACRPRPSCRPRPIRRRFSKSFAAIMARNC